MLNRIQLFLSFATLAIVVYAGLWFFIWDSISHEWICSEWFVLSALVFAGFLVVSLKDLFCGIRADESDKIFAAVKWAGVAGVAGGIVPFVIICVV